MSTESGKKVVIEKEAIHPYRWRVVWASFLIIGVGFFLTIRSLRQNDAAIQHSRVTSCIHIYGAFDEIFKPFFPPVAKQTVKQKSDLKKLHARVVKLQKRCPTQTKLDK